MGRGRCAGFLKYIYICVCVTFWLLGVLSTGWGGGGGLYTKVVRMDYEGVYYAGGGGLSYLDKTAFSYLIVS